MKDIQKKKKIVIVGAGPAGLLLAHYLARRPHYDILIIERRDDPLTQAPKDTRSFPIALDFRGRNALNQVGLFDGGNENNMESKGVYLGNICFHKKNGKELVIPKNPKNFSIDRNQITMTLIQRLQKADSIDMNPSTLLQAIKFSTSMKKIDLDNNQITVVKINDRKEQEGSEYLISFDYLIAADGARSKIREILTTQNKVQCRQVDDTKDYRTIFLSNNINDESLLDKYALHGWMISDGSTLIAAPIHEDCLTGAYIFDNGADPFVNLRTADEVLEFFDKLQPNIRHLISQEEALALLNRPTSTGVSVRCNKLHVDNKVVLIGDAAHAVSASLGQGCNSALQDVQIFGSLLDKYNDDWSKALPLYTTQRLPDAHAINELSAYAVATTKWMKAEWFLRTTLKARLPLWLSKLILRPMPRDLLDDKDANYSYSYIAEQTKWWLDRVKMSEAE